MSFRTKALFIAWFIATGVLAILVDLLNLPIWIYAVIILVWEIGIFISALDDVSKS